MDDHSELPTHRLETTYGNAHGAPPFLDNLEKNGGGGGSQQPPSRAKVKTNNDAIIKVAFTHKNRPSSLRDTKGGPNRPPHQLM